MHHHTERASNEIKRSSGANSLLVNSRVEASSKHTSPVGPPSHTKNLGQIRSPALHDLQRAIGAEQSNRNGSDGFGNNAEVARSATSTPCEEISRHCSTHSCLPATSDLSFRDSCHICNECTSPSVSKSSADNAGLVARRIFFRSQPLASPSPPYSIDTDGSSHNSSSGVTTSCNNHSANCGCSVSGGGVTCTSDIFSIDSVSLASAVLIPHLLPIFRRVWEDSNANSWPSASSKIGLGPSDPSGISGVEVWKLRPSTEVSNQFKLWGNEALRRGRLAAAEALYLAAIMLLPSKSSKGEGSDALFAVLSANRALALLRLGRVREAVRAATVAVATDPLYRKAWHRRAAALVSLREKVEEYFQSAGSNFINRNCHSSASWNEIIRSCLEHIDYEIAEAQRMSMSQAKPTDAQVAAAGMLIGTCGCDSNVACSRSSESIAPEFCSRRLWIRGDINLQRNEKGWGMVTTNAAVAEQEGDSSLVLEEEAFAVWVHPKHCAAIPKIPLAAAFPCCELSNSQAPYSLELHADEAMRRAWEELVEESAVSKMCTSENVGKEDSDVSVESADGVHDVCAGCATVPARAEAAASVWHSQALDSWNVAINYLLRPTLPVLPCGSCTGALFCCHVCKDGSSHKRVCSLPQHVDQDQHQECWMGVQTALRQRNTAGSTWEAAGKSAAWSALSPLALSLPDPHRHIARQLLASFLPSTTTSSSKRLDAEDHCALARSAVNAGGALTPSGLRKLREPVWQQLLSMTSSVVVDSTKITDWLLNAAWLAGDAVASGRVLQCGGLCLLCKPFLRQAPTVVDSSVPEAALQSTQTRATEPEDALVEMAKIGLCSNCCACCREWCSHCCTDVPDLQSSGVTLACQPCFPRCLVAAALHAYGVACCNSFTVRVMCDPEEDAVPAGTAFFLAASLLNHSCTPNAFATFGELSLQGQRYQKHHGDFVHFSSPQDVRSSLSNASVSGRGALLQIRLCTRGKCEDSQEICISYGPIVGLQNSSWGCRQDWLLRNAGFFCLCEACQAPRYEGSVAIAGDIPFRHELLCGYPCPHCTSGPRVHQLLEEVLRSDCSKQKRYVLLEATVLHRRSLDSRLRGDSVPTTQQRFQMRMPFSGFSVLSEVPAEALNFVTVYSKLLSTTLTEGEPQHPWTKTQALAILGHSCARLWHRDVSASPDSRVVIASVLNSNGPFFVCSGFYCLNCRARFAFDILENRRAAIAVQLDGLLRQLGSSVTSLVSSRRVRSCMQFADILKETMRAISGALAASGFLSADAWRALHAVARAAYAQAKIARREYGDERAYLELLNFAAMCQSAGIYVLLQRLPLRLEQPEVSAQMYKAAMLFSQAGSIIEAKQILRAAEEAAVHSCGSHSITHYFVKELLLWLEEKRV